MVQRVGSQSRLVFYDEGTDWNTDPGTPEGVILPIADQESFGTNRDLINAPVYTGDRQPRGSIQGMINATGDLPMALEFTTVGRLLKVFMGPAGYTRAGTLHKFRIAAPGSCQLEKVSLETATIYIRAKGVRIDNMSFNSQAAGVGRYGVRVMGSGTEVYTTLDASPTDDGYVAADYFNGYIIKDGTSLATAANFSVNLGNALSRQDTLFNAGIAAGINPGIFSIDGALALIFENMDYYNNAVNFDNVSLECFWSNAPLALATQWLRMKIPAVKVSRATPRMGGEAGIVIEQNYRGQKPSVGQAAELISGNIQNYIIPATANLGVKVNGGGTVTKAITTGTRTAQQIVTDLQATGGIAGAVSDVYNGRVRIRTTTFGSDKTLQIDTTVTDSVHTVLGFDGVAVSGYDLDAVVVELYNARSSDY